MTIGAEARFRQLYDTDDIAGLATEFVKLHGADIMGFIAGRMGRSADVSEVFSMFAEEFWKDLPRFRWECTLRGFAYILARNAVVRFSTASRRESKRRLNINEAGEYARTVEHMRTATPDYMKSEIKSRMQEIRRQLSDIDQQLLVLKVDKKLSWKELAVVLGEAKPGSADELIDREAARLRKRMQLIKDRLRRLAEAEGLIHKKT
jgi:RNA polymerase sigma-70 factor (ECF subfamily)